MKTITYKNEVIEVPANILKMLEPECKKRNLDPAQVIQYLLNVIVVDRNPK